MYISQDEDAAAEELKKKRVAEYEAKKANKPKTIAKVDDFSFHFGIPCT